MHQRELHSDTPTFALALRAALRQAPKVILVGEMRDRETIEIALTAAETGHLVFSTLHTIDASKTVERIVGTLRRRRSADGPHASRRLVPLLHLAAPAAAQTTAGASRCSRSSSRRCAPATTSRRARPKGKSLLDAMRDGELDGMQHFDGEIEKLVREGMITIATGLLNATNPGNLRVQLADVAAERGRRR